MKQIKYFWKIVVERDKSIIVWCILSSLFGAARFFPAIIFSQYIVDGLIIQKSFNILLICAGIMVGSSLVLHFLFEFFDTKLRVGALNIEIMLPADLNRKFLRLAYKDQEDGGELEKFYAAFKISNSNNFYVSVQAFRSLFLAIFSGIGIIGILSYINVWLIFVVAVLVVLNSIISLKIKLNNLKRMWQCGRL